MPRILLVEDNPDNREMLIRRLERRGYEVLVAEDGQQGVDLATAQQPDLILMDMSLPVMDGYTATGVIKGNPRTQHIPVIGLSANAMQGDAERGLAAGCDDYDTKPVELPRLLEKMQALLGKEPT